MKAIAFATLFAVTAPALAAAGDPEEGLTFARDVCADCHAVEASPTAMTTEAPRSFIEIAKDAKMTETAIRVFLRTPHDRMPDFLLTGDQTDDLVAYFMELKATAR